MESTKSANINKTDFEVMPFVSTETIDVARYLPLHLGSHCYQRNLGDTFYRNKAYGLSIVHHRL